jgi:hypothetical protein
VEFRRAHTAISEIELHQTTASNPAVRLELAGASGSGAVPSIQSSDRSLQVLEVARRGHSDVIGFRVRVPLSVSHRRRVTVTAVSGNSRTTLNVSLVPALALPDRDTDVGAVTRLLMSEARGPSAQNYNAADTVQSMQWMRRVLENRLANNPRQFGAPHAANLIDIIKAPNQFAGFSGYPNYEARSRLQQMVNLANNDADPRQAKFAEFIGSAIAVAQAESAVTDPITTGLYGWRTQGSGSPGGRFGVYQTVAGNTFYTLTQ